MVVLMDFQLRGRAALVTGGSSGIGRATAIAFAGEGADVGITFHTNKDGAAETVRACTSTGVRAAAVRMDLADPGGIRAAVAELRDRLGGIDVLVSNAADTARHAEAFNPAGPAFADLPPERWQPLLTTGLEGVFHLVQAALPGMRGNSFGRVAFVSSGAAERGGPREQAYAATKAALVGLTSSLAKELGRDGILVNIVMPALTSTERVLATVPEPVRAMIAGHLASGRLSTPDDVARAIVFLCSPANGNITGETVRVTGGL